MGKPLHGGLSDIKEAAEISNYFAGLAESSGGETSLNTPGMISMSLRQPYGVVASIIPWNFPSMIVRLIASATKPYTSISLDLWGLTLHVFHSGAMTLFLRSQLAMPSF
jgi:hypothetical protein